MKHFDLFEVLFILLRLKKQKTLLFRFYLSYDLYFYS